MRAVCVLAAHLEPARCRLPFQCRCLCASFQVVMWEQLYRCCLCASSREVLMVLAAQSTCSVVGTYVGPSVLRLALRLHFWDPCSVSLNCCSHRAARSPSPLCLMLHLFCGCYSCLRSVLSVRCFVSPHLLIPVHSVLAFSCPHELIQHSRSARLVVCLLPGSCSCGSASLASWCVPELHDVLEPHPERHHTY